MGRPQDGGFLQLNMIFLRIFHIVLPFSNRRSGAPGRSLFNVVALLQEDLVHLGARYSMCMRNDTNLEDVLKDEKRAVRRSACCVQNDGSGCLQTSQDDCSVRRYRLRIGSLPLYFQECFDSR